VCGGDFNSFDFDVLLCDGCCARRLKAGEERHDCCCVCVCGWYKQARTAAEASLRDVGEVEQYIYLQPTEKFSGGVLAQEVMMP